METFFRWTMCAEPSEDGIAGIHLVGKNIDEEKDALRLETEQEEVFQAALLAHIRDAVITTDTSFIIRSWNKAAEHIYGRKASEVIGKPMGQVVAYEYFGSDRLAARTALETRQQWGGVVRFTAPDGSPVLLDASVTPLKNSRQEVVGYIAVNRDITVKKGMENTLQNFYSAYASMEDGFFFADHQFRLTYFNPAAEIVFRKAYKQDISLGESIPGRLPDNRREVVASFFRRALKGETIEYENVLLQENETALWLGCRYFPTRDSQGNITGICGILRDITARKELEKAEAERKRMEEKLLQEKVLFEEFMKNTPLRAWIIDEQGALHYSNPVFAREFGLEASGSGSNIFQLFPEDLAWRYYQQNLEVIRGGKPLVTDEESVLPDGSKQAVKLVRFPLTIDGQAMVGGYTVDISTHIRLQEELAKSVEQFEYVTKATSDAIFEWDLEANRMQHSSFYTQLFGPQEHPMEHFEGVHPADRERVLQLVTDTLNDPEKDRWQVEYRHRSGGTQYRHIVCKSFVIRREGKAVRLIGAMQDITEQKMLQDKLIEQEKGVKREIVRSVIETQEKERRQLSVELHDNINQMVASCKLMLEIALSNPANATLFTEKAYKHLQEIITGIRRISHHLNPSTIEDIGLKEALAQLLGKTAVTEKLNITFTHHHFDEAHLALPEDKVAVYRLVQEQVANVVQHAGAQNVFVRLSSGPAKVFLAVEDDGQGFDKEAMVTGRGLRTIYHRVEYYNGKMILDTRPGKGCRLKVLLKTRER